MFIFNSCQVSLGEINTELKITDEFERKVLAFAQEWLCSKREFEFHTSGSTGSPKKMAFSREQVRASAALTKQAFGLAPGHRALLCLDTDFIAGKMMIVRALEIGMDLVCVSPIVDPLENLKETSGIEFVAVVPYQLEAILNSQSSIKKLNQIKKVIVGGAPVPTELTEKLQSLSPQFYETYGMTETLTHIAIRKLNPPEKAFQTLPGVKIYMDERLCLSIQANHLGQDVIRTNDLVNILSENSFNLIGRYDNIINTAGVKVSPEDVERKITVIMSENLAGHEYFIAGVKDQSFGERIVLLIECQEITYNLKENLIGLMKNQLRKWEVPKEIICLPAFKRTSSGKVNRSKTILCAFAR